VTAIVLALACALVYGAGDFLGGVTARRISGLAVTAIAMPAGLILLLPFAPLTGSPTPSALAWGVGGGLAGAAAVSLLYAGLAIGPMNVVAPLTAVAAAGVPVAIGVALGERPALLAWLGIALGVPAVALIASTPGASPIRGAGGRGVVLALFAGIGFGVFFVLLERADPESGAWPLVAARAAGTVLAVLLAGRQLARVRRDRRALLGAVVVGLFDTTANVLFLLAVREGLLSVVSVLVALYPASTVALAVLVYRERMSGPQRVGLAVAAGAVALITAGTV